MNRIYLKIDGMTCEHCKGSVLQALRDTAGVTSAEVDLEAGRAVVLGDANVPKLVAAVRDEGYEATPIDEP